MICICPDELAALVAGIAIAIADGRPTSEVDIIAAIFLQISDTLGTISTQRGIIEDCCNQKKQSCTDSNSTDSTSADSKNNT